MHKVMAYLVAGLMMAAACGGSDDAGEPQVSAREPTTTKASDDSTSLETSTTTQAPSEGTESEGEAVKQAYLAMWDGIIAAHESQNAEHPQLLAAAEGQALADVQSEIRSAWDDMHQYRKGTVGHSYEEGPTVTGDTATLTDCVDSSQWGVYDTSTHEVVGPSPGPGGWARVRIGLTKRGDTWMVTSYEFLGHC